MNQKIFLLLAAVLIAFSAPDAFAQKGRDKERCREHPGSMEKHHKGLFFGDPEMMKEKLGLSDDQVDKIAQINLGYKKELLSLHEIIAPKRIKLKRMLLEDNVDLNKVKDILKEISDLQVDIRMIRIRQGLDIEKTLTPAQKTKLRSARMERAQMRHRFFDEAPIDPEDDME